MIYFSEDSEYFEIHGHAHTGPGEVTDEEKEACAAVTALAQGLILALESWGIYGHTVHKGAVTIKKDALPDNAWNIYSAFIDALRFVSKGYPEQTKWIE